MDELCLPPPKGFHLGSDDESSDDEADVAEPVAGSSPQHQDELMTLDVVEATQPLMNDEDDNTATTAVIVTDEGDALFADESARDGFAEAVMTAPAATGKEETLGAWAGWRSEKR